MTTLLTMYQSNLESKGVDASSYSKQHLKARLQKHYGDELIFHTPTARFKPELVYGSTIMVQDILNAWAELQSKKEEERIENEIFRVVKHIKQEISEMGGICTAPLNVNDVSLECARRLIPDSLYLLLRLMITSDITKVTEVIASKAECKNSNEERLVISIAQDIMYCCGKSRVKLPKHVSLAMCVQHLTGSKTLVTLLNRMGHCCSYDDLRAVDTSIATEVLAKAQEYGTVVPSNMSTLLPIIMILTRRHLMAKIQHTPRQWWFIRKNSLDQNHPQRLLAIMERHGDRFRPVRALLI